MGVAGALNVSKVETLVNAPGFKPRLRSDLHFHRDVNPEIIVVRDLRDNRRYQLFAIECQIARYMDGTRDLDTVTTAARTHAPWATRAHVAKLVVQIAAMGFLENVAADKLDRLRVAEPSEYGPHANKLARGSVEAMEVFEQPRPTGADVAGELDLDAFVALDQDVEDAGDTVVDANGELAAAIASVVGASAEGTPSVEVTPQALIPGAVRMAKARRLPTDDGDPTSLVSSTAPPADDFPVPDMFDDVRTTIDPRFSVSRASPPPAAPERGNQVVLDRLSELETRLAQLDQQVKTTNQPGVPGALPAGSPAPFLPPPPMDPRVDQPPFGREGYWAPRPALAPSVPEPRRPVDAAGERPRRRRVVPWILAIFVIAAGALVVGVVIGNRMPEKLGSAERPADAVPASPPEAAAAAAEPAAAAAEPAPAPSVAIDAGVAPVLSPDAAAETDETDETAAANDGVAAGTGSAAEGGDGEGVDGDDGADSATGAGHGSCVVSVSGSPRRAKVFAGERSLGTTPLRAEVECGEVTLRIVGAGHKTKTQTVVARADQPTEVSFRLTRVMTKLRVLSAPPGATVRMRGRSVGKTPLTVAVPAFAASAVSVKLDGYRTWSRTVRVGARTETVKAMLFPSASDDEE